MRVTVIGLGLIGGSLLRALAAAGHRVTGFDSDPRTREAVRRAGFAVGASVAEAAAGAELVALAVPLPGLPAVLAELTGGEPAESEPAESEPAESEPAESEPAESEPGESEPGESEPEPAEGKPGESEPGGSEGPAGGSQRAGYDGLVTDVTSVKQPVRELAARFGLRRFVGGHPMAGKEISGFAAAEPALFAGCAWVLCLEPRETGLTDWLSLAAVCTALGARVVPATAAEHDRAVAEISHVPHLFAAALAGQLAGHPLAGTLAAGSFRDGTRVAATRADLIVAMCGGNAAEVDTALGRLIGDLERMRAALTPDPVRTLTPLVAPAGELRRRWPVPAGDPVVVAADPAELLALGRAGGWITAVAPDLASVTAMRPGSDRNSA